jgi:hypothetical protein
MAKWSWFEILHSLGSIKGFKAEHGEPFFCIDGLTHLLIYSRQYYVIPWIINNPWWY